MPYETDLQRLYHDEPIKTTDLEPLNYEMVRGLKSRGMVEEARKLIKKHQEGVKKAKQEALKDYQRKQNKKRRIKLKKEGKCTVCAKKKKEERKDKCKCKKCASYKPKKMRTNITETEKPDWKLMTVIHKGEVIYQRRLHRLTIPLIREIIKELGEQLEHKKIL